MTAIHDQHPRHQRLRQSRSATETEPTVGAIDADGVHSPPFVLCLRSGWLGLALVGFHLPSYCQRAYLTIDQRQQIHYRHAGADVHDKLVPRQK